MEYYNPVRELAEDVGQVTLKTTEDMVEEQQEYYALKRVRGGHERWKAEAEYLQTLCHPNILSLSHAFCDTGGHGDWEGTGQEFYYRYFIVTEAMDCNLGEFMRTRNPSPALIRSICHQLLWAVEHLHINGVSHTNINPSHVLISHGDTNQSASSVTPKLTGFAFSKRTNDGGIVELLPYDDDVIEQTDEELMYRAPELITRDIGDERREKRTSFDGFRSDMWSVGMIIAQLLNGGVPLFVEESREMMGRERILETIRALDAGTSCVGELMMGGECGREAKEFLELVIPSDPFAVTPSATLALAHPFSSSSSAHPRPAFSMKTASSTQHGAELEMATKVNFTWQWQSQVNEARHPCHGDTWTGLDSIFPDWRFTT